MFCDTFVTLSLFQSNLYEVLARRKDPKNSAHRDLFKTKNFKNFKTLQCRMKMSNIYNEILETMSPATYHHNDFVLIQCTWAHDVWLHIAGTYEPKECSTHTDTHTDTHI